MQQNLVSFNTKSCPRKVSICERLAARAHNRSCLPSSQTPGQSTHPPSRPNTVLVHALRYSILARVRAGCSELFKIRVLVLPYPWSLSAEAIYTLNTFSFCCVVSHTAVQCSCMCSWCVVPLPLDSAGAFRRLFLAASWHALSHCSCDGRHRCAFTIRWSSLNTFTFTFNSQMGDK